jgi:FAD/FMN-containing dehydrogenase
MGGHGLHGGYGLASHTYGLALDFMIEAMVVLADSRVVNASTTENSDLFWALRGAGCSFGIVTEMEFRAPPENFLFYYIYAWNATQAQAGFQAIQNYANSTLLPPEMNMRVVIGILSGTFIWILEGVYHGSEAEFQAAAEPLLAELGPAYLTINSTLSWIDSLLYANNNALLPGGGSGEQLETPLDYHPVGSRKIYPTSIRLTLSQNATFV